MSDPTLQQQSATVKLPEAQTQLSLPAVASQVVSSVSSLLKLPAPISSAPATDIAPKKEDAAPTDTTTNQASQTISESSPTRSILSFVAQKAGDAVAWMGKKASELLECRSFEDLGRWGKRVFSEALEGLQRVAEDFREFVQSTRADQRTEAAAAKAHEYTTMLTELAVSAEEIKAERKRAMQEEADWERAHRPSHTPEQEKTREFEHITKLSPRSADRAEVQDLKIAITTNHIPTEDMPEVRRFLAAVEAEKDAARRDQKPGSES
ncbi:MAG: hypothetical protein U0136_15775 [Bdellovibrionota bacterium]